MQALLHLFAGRAQCSRKKGRRTHMARKHERHTIARTLHQGQQAHRALLIPRREPAAAGLHDHSKCLHNQAAPRCSLVLALRLKQAEPDAPTCDQFLAARSAVQPATAERSPCDVRRPCTHACCCRSTHALRAYSLSLPELVSLPEDEELPLLSDPLLLPLLREVPLEELGEGERRRGLRSRGGVAERRRGLRSRGGLAERRRGLRSMLRPLQHAQHSTAQQELARGGKPSCLIQGVQLPRQAGLPCDKIHHRYAASCHTLKPHDAHLLGSGRLRGGLRLRRGGLRRGGLLLRRRSSRRPSLS